MTKLDFCPFVLLTAVKELGKRAFYGEMAANTPDKLAA
jgi:hypothetical protein